MEKVKKQFNFPSAFTILFIILIIAVVLTWVVPRRFLFQTDL